MTLSICCWVSINILFFTGFGYEFKCTLWLSGIESEREIESLKNIKFDLKKRSWKSWLQYKFRRKDSLGLKKLIIINNGQPIQDLNETAYDII